MAEAVKNPTNLLDALGARGRAAIERESDLLAIPAGHILFEQGDKGDDLFILRSGSLGVYMPQPSGHLRLLALIRSGETAGEMAVISGEPRSATVIAIRDSELLRLSKEKFDRLIKGKPTLLEGLNRLLVQRLRQVSTGEQPALDPKFVAFLPTSSRIDASEIAHELGSRLSAQGHRVKLVGPEASKQSSEWFNALEAEYDQIFFCGSLENVAWNRLCARQSDRMFVLADADHIETELPEDLLAQRGAHQLLDLIILHAETGARSSSTTRWLERLPVNRHFHLRRDKPADWDRIGRMITGSGVGLVLSGGGARAFAQIGVLRALDEANIPIDAIGGTSMGGILAAGYALEWGVDEITERVHDAFVQTNPLSDVTLPLIGLVKGRKVERLLEENFGGSEIPDLWRPFFCVSSDLTSADIHVHARGNLAQALRATIALPGILPPIVGKSSVLVDGAVINNLPVDVMRSIHQGPIMAVDVARDRSMTPDMLSVEPQNAFFEQLRRPPIVSILMRSGTLTGQLQNSEQARAANLLLEPPLGEIDIRDWQAFDQAVEIGYRHASEVLAHSGHLLNPMSGVSSEKAAE
jgi:NTE family protein